MDPSSRLLAILVGVLTLAGCLGHAAPTGRVLESAHPTSSPSAETTPDAAPTPSRRQEPPSSAAPPPPAAPSDPPPKALPPRRAVVVATFDTGANPFHPCWRENAHGSARDDIPDLPVDARPLPLALLDTFEASKQASKAALDAIEDGVVYFIPGTRLLFYGRHGAATQLLDAQDHGALASSQIACGKYGFAPDVYVLILNWYAISYPQAADLVEWVAHQPWIDIVHLNVQDTPVPTPGVFDVDTAINAAVDKGKFVVVAAGNGVYGMWVNYPMELSRFTGPPGTLVAGACDNDGYALFSNLNPHTVMDGGATRAAASASYGEDSFSGTSSSSPLTTGYAAHLLHEARRHVGAAAGPGGALIRLEEGQLRPSVGPLADGILTAAELHQVIRVSADPGLGESRFDGERDIFWVPRPQQPPVPDYAKIGYGKLTEKTAQAAIAILVGTAPMPARPLEAPLYEASETLRTTAWG